jgi:hypothetical protein
MNRYSVKIKGTEFTDFTDFTDYAIYPLKWANLLDERLDEATLTLKFVPKSKQDGVFRPLSVVKLTITNSPDTYQTEKQPEVAGVRQAISEKRLIQITDKRFIVAKDTVYNNPIGGSFDTHELYIIEETKFLEAFICDTLTFRNALLNRFGGHNPARIEDFEESTGNETGFFGKCLNNGSLYVYANPNYWKNFTVKSITEVGDPVVNQIKSSYPQATSVEVVSTGQYSTAEYTSRIVIKNGNAAEQTITDLTQTVTIDLATECTLTYFINIDAEIPGSTPVRPWGKFTFVLNGVANRSTLKKWTITDVVTRCCELAEPLFGTETPRFSMNGVTYNANTGEVNAYTANSQAAKYDKVIAPEFSMTKSTLREQLQQVGGHIHAEPRLDNGKIYFDEYGGTEMSRISKTQYIGDTQTQSVDDYCTELDSTADNLVNRLNYAQGVVIEPYTNGAKSLRTEQTNIRIDESTGLIETILPIADIEKLECAAPTNAAGDVYSDFQDITSFVYEESDYNNFSSYDADVNGSKAYAIYWTRNSKNIKGLFFKNENALSPVFSQYAIYNIMRACGVKMNKGSDKASNYPKIKFRISYIPTYTARVRTNKSLVISGSKPRTLAYNQGANSVETQYYGENLKGVVARLGNVERTLTYKLTWLTDIPKAGQLFDEHNYISAVSVEMYATYFKVTIGLSRDFNRLSEYIGISSEYRQYQVSERAVYNRESVVQEYAMITCKEDVKSDSIIDSLLFSPEKLEKLFLPSANSADLLTCAGVVSRYHGGSVTLNLPLVSSSFGNTVSFRFAFADNYSAGQKSSKVVKGDITTYYAEYVPYTDYYGRLKKLDFWLQTKPVEVSGEAPRVNPFDLPETNEKNFNSAIQTNSRPWRYRKDSAEIPAINYQLSFVTDDDTIIIGSEIARNYSLVNASPITTFELYFFNKRLPLFAEQLDVSGATKYTEGTLNLKTFYIERVVGNLTEEDYPWLLFVDDDENEIDLSGYSGEAWAIVTGSNEVAEVVTDENGNTTTQMVQNGHKLILGQNKHHSGETDDTFKLPRFVVKHKIYD